MADSLMSFQSQCLKGGEHCVFMLHGLGANALELQRLSKQLQEDGFSVVIPHLDGYAFQTTAQPWKQWVEQAQTELTHLQKKYSSVSVVGLSMGAVLAMALAQRQSTPLSALVLLSASLAYDGWGMPWYRPLLDISSWLPFAKRYRMPESEPFGVKNEEMRSAIKHALKSKQISESGVDALGYDLIKEGQHLISEVRANMQLIDCPTLIIHSVDDEVVHVRNAEWAYRKIRSVEKEMIYLGDSYHMITIDNERETVNQETSRFLKKTVNSQQEKPVFEIAPMKSAQIRRLLRKIQAQLFPQ